MSRKDEREEVFKTLYASEVKGNYRPDKETDFISELVNGVQRRADELDATLEEHLEDWRMNRVYPVERIVLRMGAYEILHMSTDKAVVINEAVEIAKKFGDTNTPGFVNGILDNLEKLTTDTEEE